jgi:hypothetical protein
MDGRLFRWVNRLANRTGWAHGFFTAYAKYGIALFAILLVVTYLRLRDVKSLTESVGVPGGAGARGEVDGIDTDARWLLPSGDAVYPDVPGEPLGGTLGGRLLGLTAVSR